MNFTIHFVIAVCTVALTGISNAHSQQTPVSAKATDEEIAQMDVVRDRYNCLTKLQDGPPDVVNGAQPRPTPFPVQHAVNIERGVIVFFGPSGTSVLTDNG